MTAITVRLSSEDHKLLQLYCLMTGKSQNAVMTELLHAELDQAMPGKREAIRSAGPGTLWEELGVPQPQPSSLAHRWAGSVIDGLRDEPGSPGAQQVA